MDARAHDVAVNRLRTAFELFEAGVEIKRATIRRAQPGISRADEVSGTPDTAGR